METLDSAINYLSENLGSLQFKWSGHYDKVVEVSTVGMLEDRLYTTMFRCPAGMEVESIVGAIEDHKIRVKMSQENM